MLLLMALSHLFMAKQYSTVYIFHVFFIHSSVNGHLTCIHVLAIVTSTAMNTRGARIFSNQSSLQIHTQDWDCWIIWQFYFQLFKEPPPCFPQWLCQFTFPEIWNFYILARSCTSYNITLPTESKAASHNQTHQYFQNENMNIHTKQDYTQSHMSSSLPPKKLRKCFWFSEHLNLTTADEWFRLHYSGLAEPRTGHFHLQALQDLTPPSVASAPAAAMSPGNLLEVLTLKSHPSSTESELAF